MFDYLPPLLNSDNY